MERGVGHSQKLGKYNRKRSVVTNRPLDTTIPNYNSQNKYNENIDGGSKEPINTDNYYRPSNFENYASFLFLDYFIHLGVEDNHIFEPLSTLYVGILPSDVFRGVYLCL